MKRRHNDQYNERDNLAEIIWGIGAFYILYLILLWFTNKANFWRWLLYGFGVVIILFISIFIWRKIKEEARRRKIDCIRQAELENWVKNFINRFGFGQEKSKDPWEYRNYRIDRHRIRELQEFLSQRKIKFSTSDIEMLLYHYIDEKERGVTFDGVNVPTRSFSKLSGSDFEKLLSRLYEAMSYSVELKGRTGDQGGDLIVTKDQERILIQAKCYSNSTVGNSAVQEVVAAKNFYDCNRAVVVATNNFTKEATELAKTNNVELIPREVLQRMLLDYLHESWN